MVYDPTNEFSTGRGANTISTERVERGTQAAYEMVDDEAAEHVEKITPTGYGSSYPVNRIRDFKAQANQHQDRMTMGAEEGHKFRANMAIYEALKAEAQDAGAW